MANLFIILFFTEFHIKIEHIYSLDYQIGFNYAVHWSNASHWDGRGNADAMIQRERSWLVYPIEK